MKSTIVPITIALFQPTLATKGIKVGSRNPQNVQPANQEERDLYTSETIDLEEAQCCTGTSPTELEVVYGDDEYLGTNRTVSPTEDSRSTPIPTEQPTDATVTTPAPTLTSYTPAPSTTAVTTPEPTVSNIVTPEPTPFPSPYNDDGGLTDDAFISTPVPSGKPTKSHGYLPTSSYQPTDAIDDWASGWMPTSPSSDDDTPLVNNDDTDDWHGGYPVGPSVESKAGKGSKSGSKSGKGSKGSASVTDDAYRGYGLSKVSSLLNSEVSSAYDGREVMGGLVGVGGLMVYMYL